MSPVEDPIVDDDSINGRPHRANSSLGQGEGAGEGAAEEGAVD
jgi:hypothetical protein